MTIGEDEKFHEMDLLVYAPLFLFHPVMRNRTEDDKEKYVKFDVSVENKGNKTVEWSVRESKTLEVSKRTLSDVFALMNSAKP